MFQADIFLYYSYMSIRKEEYIAKYGEEAYEAEKERRRNAAKKWRENNPDRSKAINKKYRESHIEIVRERDRRRREILKDYYKEKDKERYNRNREKIVSQKKEHYLKNREEILAKSNSYHKTKEGRANNLLSSYVYHDKTYNRGNCTLTQRWILENIFTSSCIYCGETDWRKLGCDRIDNTKAHTPDNVVCACWDCNNQRGKLTFNEFISYKRANLNSKA